MLPRLWSLCERDWMALRDCRRQDSPELPLPYEARSSMRVTLQPCASHLVARSVRACSLTAA